MPRGGAPLYWYSPVVLIASINSCTSYNVLLLIPPCSSQHAARCATQIDIALRILHKFAECGEKLSSAESR